MKVNNLYIHHQLERPLSVFTKELPHALLISGSEGVGLHTIAHSIATQSGKIVTEILPDEKGTISIEVIRELYAQTRSKQQARVIIIDDADAMTHAAQNALLKLLEEPGESISFILTSHKPSALLRTIRSRVQEVSIPFITQEDTNTLVQELGVHDASTKSQILFMASGRPAEITRLVSNEEYFNEQKEIVRDAKQYLQGGAYEKIIVIQKYSTDRYKSQQLIKAATAIVEFSLKSRPQDNLLDQLTTLTHTHEKIQENRHVKTQLLKSVF